MSTYLFLLEAAFWGNLEGALAEDSLNVIGSEICTRTIVSEAFSGAFCIARQGVSCVPKQGKGCVPKKARGELCTKKEGPQAVVTLYTGQEKRNNNCSGVPLCRLMLLTLVKKSSDHCSGVHPCRPMLLRYVTRPRLTIPFKLHASDTLKFCKHLFLSSNEGLRSKCPSTCSINSFNQAGSSYSHWG
jgi:hypothetical protein